MTKWIHVVHERTGHETNIPPRALSGYERRGWSVKEHPDERSAKRRTRRKVKAESPEPTPETVDTNTDSEENN